MGAHAARQKALAGMQAGGPRAAQQQALAATLQQQQQQALHMQQQAPYGYQYMGYFPGQPYFQPHLPRGAPPNPEPHGNQYMGFLLGQPYFQPHLPRGALLASLFGHPRSPCFSLAVWLVRSVPGHARCMRARWCALTISICSSPLLCLALQVARAARNCSNRQPQCFAGC